MLKLPASFALGVIVTSAVFLARDRASANSEPAAETASTGFRSPADTRANPEDRDRTLDVYLWRADR